jgi:hypothetical protein
MPRAKRSRPKYSRAKKSRKRSGKRQLRTPTITVYANTTSSGTVMITPPGHVNFVINYPANKNTCTIPFGQISFSNEARPGGNSVKVG